MIKRLIIKYGNAIASLSLALALRYSIGSCRFILHQPEEPAELNDTVIKSVIKPHLLPAEMENIIIKKDDLISSSGKLVIEVEDR